MRLLTTVRNGIRQVQESAVVQEADSPAERPDAGDDGGQ
jgi:hypothetical protein